MREKELRKIRELVESQAKKGGSTLYTVVVAALAYFPVLELPSFLTNP